VTSATLSTEPVDNLVNSFWMTAANARATGVANRSVFFYSAHDSLLNQ